MKIIEKYQISGGRPFPVIKNALVATPEPSPVTSATPLPLKTKSGSSTILKEDELRVVHLERLGVRVLDRATEGAVSWGAVQPRTRSSGRPPKLDTEMLVN